MVLVEGCIIGLTIMASTAMARGMSPFVFVVYTNALGSIILLPFSFFYHRKDRVTIAQNLAFVGLSYSSPIVACGMANQLPALSFILGIILRTTRFDWKSSASSLTLAFWNIVQVGTLKICPQVMKIVSFYSLFGTIQSAVLALFLERDPNAWRLELNFELLIIVLTAIFGSLIRSSVQIWCTRLKGPYFVPAFKPFGIPWASTFGCLIFGDTFHYGSMMGAFVCGVGYYTVLWGQIKDEELQKLDHRANNSSVDEKVPLLQDQDSQV
ncbi:hypothetical protein DH2020_032638 [Rehmannia glutinosa]|uniref:WAT1-related protein n=1 Tax=Rehmannia glutinosa TaxID=99300 RepID=A0ABR0VG92_REHGL